jgi:hypothetical protein
MSKGQARWLAALACVIALSAGCSSYSVPSSGSNPRADQQRDRDNEPAGMRSGGGGGGY